MSHHQQQASDAQDHRAQPAPARGWALTSLVTGIGALALCWVPVVGLVLGVVALVTCLVAIRKAASTAMSWTGGILGGLGVIASVTLVIVTGSALYVPLWNSDTSTATTSTPSPSSSVTDEVSAADTSEQPSASPTVVTASQEAALAEAESYMRYMTFSHESLVYQLEFEGFSHADATWAADTLDVDWDAQAVSNAEETLESRPMSKDGLVTQLDDEGFTEAQVTHALDAVDVDWMANAVEMAHTYLSHTAMTREDMVNQLEFEGFTTEEAEHGAVQAGL